MTALPPATDVEHLLIDGPTSTALSAYRNIILPAEQAALSSSKDDRAKLIHARVVGYLLLYPPSQEASSSETQFVRIRGGECRDRTELSQYRPMELSDDAP